MKGMKNGITKLIMAGYGDLRKSEKKAADYILDHMEDGRGRPLTGWRRRRTSASPRCSGCSGHWDLRDTRIFKYRLVAELASAEPEKARSAVPMYGYTLREEMTLDEIPAYMTEDSVQYDGGDTEKHSHKDIQKSSGYASDGKIDQYLQRGKLRGDGPGSSCETPISGAALPVFQRLLLSADLSGKPFGGGRGCGNLLFRGVKRHGGCDEDREEGGSHCDRHYEFQGFSDQPVCGYPDLHQPGAVYLRECHILADASASDRGHAVYGDHSVGL